MATGLFCGALSLTTLVALLSPAVVGTPFRPSPTGTTGDPLAAPPGSWPQEWKKLQLQEWLKAYNEELEERRRSQALAMWDALVRPSAEATASLQAAQEAMAVWSQRRVHEARRMASWGVAHGQTRRMLSFISRGPQYSPVLARHLASLVSRMRDLYTSATLSRGDLTLRGEGDVTTFMRTCRDPEDLLWAWEAWRDAVGPPARPLFVRAVEVLNIAARRGGYMDMGSAWQAELDFDEGVDVRSVVESLYNEIEPLYKLLYTRVRYALAKLYGEDVVQLSRPIPAHLLGDLWGQNWISLLDLILPNASNSSFSSQSRIPVREMVKKGEKFFLSLGFPPLSEKFWGNSILGDSEASNQTVCHPRSLDMYAPGDYRMILCGTRGTEAQEVAYHELGHIYYFQSYSEHPAIFRDGANSAFHETIGDTIQLFATSPMRQDSHKTHTESGSSSFHSLPESELRHLLALALQKLPVFAFARVVDEWRWAVFRGEIPEEEYNTWWWRLTLRYQGLAPPSERSEKDFDPAAKFHIVDNTPYIRYFIATVTQFQLHKGLCEVSRDRPLSPSLCRIDGSREAGSLLRWVLAQGSSTSWQDLLEAASGSRKLRPFHLLNFFSPLREWLEREVKMLGLREGW